MIAALSLAIGWLYLAVAINTSVAWSGDPGGLPLAAWLLPLAGAIGPWVFARTEPGTGLEVSRRRGRRAGLGVLGCLLAIGVMIFSPLVGAVVALAWIAGLNLLR